MTNGDMPEPCTWCGGRGSWFFIDICPECNGTWIKNGYNWLKQSARTQKESGK